MGNAVYWSRFSEDPNTQVGAYIVDEYNAPVSTGYNGFPGGVEATEKRLERPHKYKYMMHAERNALTFSGRRYLNGCTLYVTKFPCSGCMAELIQKKTSRIIVPTAVEKDDRWYDDYLYAKEMLDESGTFVNYLWENPKQWEFGARILGDLMPK